MKAPTRVLPVLLISSFALGCGDAQPSSDESTARESSAVQTAKPPPKNVDVSKLPGPQSEVGIAINPKNERNLVADSNDIETLNTLGVWFSFDAGATWSPNLISASVDGFGADDVRFDPNVTFDSDGNLYVVYCTTGTDNRVVVARSEDGGRSFDRFTVVATDETPDANNLHTPMVTTRREPCATDDVLVVWARVVEDEFAGERIQAALSTDLAATFSVTNDAINDTLQRTFLPWAAADPAGSFHVVWEVNEDAGTGEIFHDVLDAATLASATPRRCRDWGTTTASISG